MSHAGEYHGNYCVECEQFIQGEGNCPVHQKPLEPSSEAGYFFRLSRYQAQLLQHLRANPEFISPRSRYEEALAFLTHQPLQDLSVTRGSTSWGIKVPGEPDQVIYVWLDALLSYISGFDGNERDVLANTEHFIGKDILIFHVVYWPAILLALGLPLPKTIRVNGWLTVEGKKIAKSSPETIVDPAELAERYSLDALRYYLLSAAVGGQDVGFREAHLKEAVNGVLANTVGNLASRCAGLFARHFAQGIERPVLLPEGIHELVQESDRLFREIDEDFAAGDVSRACRRCFEFARTLNAAFQNAAPWHLSSDQLGAWLWWFHGLLQDLSLLLVVFTPELGLRTRQVLGLPEAVELRHRFDPALACLRFAEKTAPLVQKC